MSWRLSNPSEPSAVDADFASRYPSYRDLLDEHRVASWVRARLDTAVRFEDPFPYVQIDDILPPDVFALLDAAWPPIEFFAVDGREKKADLIPAATEGEAEHPRRQGYSRLPPSVQEVWSFFLHRINRAIVGPWLLQVFEPEIGHQLSMLTRHNQDHLVEKPMLRPPFHPRMNIGRLMMRKAGYQLRPHVDAVAYLATTLYYFPAPGDGENLGTALYRADRALDPSEIFDRSSTTYFDEAGIPAEQVRVVPFRTNTMLAFANTPRSAHGNQLGKTTTWRRVFQSHLSLKDDAAAL